MIAFSQFIIGAVFLWTNIELSTADCNGVYFHFADGIRRPVFPLDVCAQAEANGVEFSYQYVCDSTRMDAIQYLYVSPLSIIVLLINPSMNKIVRISIVYFCSHSVSDI